MDNGTKCCMHCFYCRSNGPLLECKKRKIGRLIVDMFFCCPMWAPDWRSR